MPALVRRSIKNNLQCIKELQEDDAGLGIYETTCKEKGITQPTNCIYLHKCPFLEKNSGMRITEHVKDTILRAIFGILLIIYFWFTIYLGPIAIMVTTLAIQVKCFSEIIDVAYKTYSIHELPLFKFISWDLLIAVNCFFFGETLSEYFNVFSDKNYALKVLVSYHRFVSFCMYFLGMVWFVLSLRKEYDMHQFSLLAYAHIALLLVVVQSYMIVMNIFQGIIWLALPVTLVVCNDIMAYICGKNFGRTPLIRVSPKKTWEGFIGAAISTVIYGIISAYVLSNYSYFTCPIEYVEKMGKIEMIHNCEASSTFEMSNFAVSLDIFGYLCPTIHFRVCPFILHTVILSVFCSIIAPFGGFFASGLKRAFKVKDFGETIPGHGGILDRFDCQFITATFVNVYISSFIKSLTPEKVFNKVLYLQPEQQVQFFNMLKESLKDRL